MKTILLMICIALVPLLLSAHGNEDHLDTKGEKMNGSKSETIKDNMMMVRLSSINEIYQSDVKPIFEKKCVDCHGSPDKYPWYYVVPGIKQVMNYDIKEAKKHIEMSDDFPFGGHGDPLSDLQSLKNVVEEGSMPPLRYWLIQASARLNKDDKKFILDWIVSSIKLLSEI